MWNNAEHFEAYAAVPGMGSVLHTLNLRLPPDQLAWIINDAEDHVIVVDASVAPLLGSIAGRLTTVRHVLVTGPASAADIEQLRNADWTLTSAQVHSYEEVLSSQPPSFAWVEDLDERSAAALCYTSGTTGNPKGVAYSHRSIYLHCLNLAMADVFGLSANDTALAVVPMFHVNAWGLPHAALLTGTSLLMPDRYLQPAPLADMIEAEQPTVAAGVPTIWAGLLDELDERRRDVSSLRDVIVGGSACPPALMHAFESRLGLRLVQAWGMTETSPLGSVARPPRKGTLNQVWSRRTSQGRLVGSVQARLRGPDGELLAHDGSAAGELEVRGPWVTGRYFEGASAQVSQNDLSESFSHDGWLRTGDIATLTPDGYLTLTDRSKDVIKSGGEWISSIELEAAILSHEGVAEAAVIAVPDERWGERPLALVVQRSGYALDIEELRTHMAAHVERWQIPERWAFVEGVPKTSVGKFDKKLLRRMHAGGDLDVLH